MASAFREESNVDQPVARGVKSFGGGAAARQRSRHVATLVHLGGAGALLGQEERTATREACSEPALFLSAVEEEEEEQATAAKGEGTE